MPSDYDLLGPFIRRGEHSLLLGSPYSGKSMLLMQLVAALQNPDQYDFLGMTAPKVNVALITRTESERIWQETAIAAGVDLDVLHSWWDVTSDTHLEFQQFVSNPFSVLIRYLDGLFRGQSQPDVLVVPSLFEWLGVPINFPDKLSAKLSELNRYLRLHNCGLIGTHLLNRAQRSQIGASPIDRVQGNRTAMFYTQALLILESQAELFWKNPSQTAARLTIVQRTLATQVIMLDRDSEGSRRWVRIDPTIRLRTTILTTNQEAQAIALFELLVVASEPIPYLALKQTWVTTTPWSSATLKRIGVLLDTQQWIEKTIHGWQVTPAGRMLHNEYRVARIIVTDAPL